MRGAIFADQPRAVHAEHDGQRLQRDVVDHVVVRALQEGGVDRDDGLRPRVASPAANVTACPSAIPTSKNRSGIAAAKMLVPVPAGIAAVIATTDVSKVAELGESLPEYGGVRRIRGGGGLLLLAGCRIVSRRKRVPLLVVLARRKSLPLLRDHVHEPRRAHALHCGERVDQHIDVVSIDRPEVAEAELLEENARREEGLHAFLPA